jgi:hypothetical protein
MDFVVVQRARGKFPILSRTLPHPWSLPVYDSVSLNFVTILAKLVCLVILYAFKPYRTPASSRRPERHHERTYYENEKVPRLAVTSFNYSSPNSKLSPILSEMPRA